MKHINWNSEKSLKLKESRDICFEDMVFHIEKGDILDDYMHPNQKRYPQQRIMVIGINNGSSCKRVGKASGFYGREGITDKDLRVLKEAKNLA